MYTKNTLLDYLGAETLASAIVVAALIVVLTAELNTVPAKHYELTVGFLSWWGTSKTGDYLAPLLIIGTLPILAALDGTLMERTARAFGPSGVENMKVATVICSLPGLAAVAMWLSHERSYQAAPIIVSAALLGLMKSGALVLTARPDLARHLVLPRAVARLTPFVLVLLLIFIRLPGFAPPAISPDDYHFGEFLVPSWMTIEFGAWPYVDITPAHGLADYIAQTTNILLFFNNPGDIGNVTALTSTALLMMLFGVLCTLLGPWPSFVICLVAPLHHQLAALSIAYASIFAVSRQQALLPYWLPIWIALGTAIFLLLPGPGGVLVVSSIPFGLYITWRSAQSNRCSFSIVVTLLTGVAIILAVTPFARTIYGAARYVLENAQVNNVAYGHPWMRDPRGGLFDVVRASWIIVALALIAFAAFARTVHEWVSASVGVLFLVLISPYTMGRIDPGLASRIGFFSVFAWCILWPLAIRRAYTNPSNLVNPRSATEQ